MMSQHINISPTAVADAFCDAIKAGMTKVQSVEHDREAAFRLAFENALKAYNTHVQSHDFTVEAITGADVSVGFWVKDTEYWISLQIKQLFEDYEKYLKYAKKEDVNLGRFGGKGFPYFDIRYQSTSNGWTQAFQLQNSLTHFASNSVDVAAWLVFDNNVGFLVPLAAVTAAVAPGRDSFTNDEIVTLTNTQYHQIYSSMKIFVTANPGKVDYQECREWFNTFLRH